MVQQLLEITTISWHGDVDMRPEQGKSEWGLWQIGASPGHGAQTEMIGSEHLNNKDLPRLGNNWIGVDDGAVTLYVSRNCQSVSGWIERH